MDHALAPPLRLVIKHPSNAIPHDQVADAVGLFLNSYAGRTGGTPGAAAPEDQLAAALGGGQAAASAVSSTPAPSVGGNAVVISQLNRLREHLRAES